jgi:hypothetical protein
VDAATTVNCSIDAHNFRSARRAPTCVTEIDNIGNALLFELAAAEAAALRRQLGEAVELAASAAILRDAELKAAELRRRLHRSIEAEKRRLDRERWRAEGGLYVNQPRADNRPSRIAVDADAWGC